MLPAGVELILASNPGPMTLEGTCTWRVDGEFPVVVDPGPLDEVHLRAVAALGPISAIVLTHGHPDHREGAGRLHELSGAPVAAWTRTWCVDSEPLRNGSRVGDLTVLHTPGHTSDSICLVRPGADPSVFTGDTLLGRGSTVVMHPDGSLTDYEASLLRLRRLTDATPGLRMLPGHGPALGLLRTVVDEQQAHRARRTRAVADAVTAGAASADDIVLALYGPLEPPLRTAALCTVRATLAYLGTDASELSAPGD